MFYIVLFGLVILAVGILLFLGNKHKNNEKYNKILVKVGSWLAISYCIIVFISIFLPDSFVLSYDSMEALGKKEGWFAFFRWLNAVAFVVLPVAHLTKSQTLKKIAVYYVIPVAILTACLSSSYLQFQTDGLGRGLTTLPFASQGFKDFLNNVTFRQIIFGLTVLIEILAPLFLLFSEQVKLTFSKKEFFSFIFVLLGILISVVPLYTPQYIVGYSNIILKAYNIWHLVWIVSIVLEGILLYYIFKDKDYDTKRVLCITLALCLFLQYNSFFQCIGTINFKRLPVQLCNIGAYFILIALITKSKKLFDFTIVLNVAGVLFALAVPDIDGKGVGYLWNMHFVYEHHNVLLIPVLALVLGVFPKPERSTLFNALKGFSIYFVSTLIIGTILNAIAVKTSNSYFEVNYLFMFLKSACEDLLPGVALLFDYTINLGYLTLYPVIQILIYVVLMVTMVGVYFLIKLLYKLTNRSSAPNNNLEISNIA